MPTVTTIAKIATAIVKSFSAEEIVAAFVAAVSNKGLGADSMARVEKIARRLAVSGSFDTCGPVTVNGELNQDRYVAGEYASSIGKAAKALIEKGFIVNVKGVLYIAAPAPKAEVVEALKAERSEKKAAIKKAAKESSLPRIKRILRTEDCGAALCPHCGAEGSRITFFLAEDGEEYGAMAGCIKLFPRMAGC